MPAVAEKASSRSDPWTADRELLPVKDQSVALDTEIPAEDNGAMMPEFCNTNIVEQFDMFMFEARFVKGDLVMLQLEKGEEIHRYYISTTATPNKAMCVGTFIDTDDRQTRTIITKEGLSGDYNLTCIINDTKYQTGVTIKC